jgi:hypothetical protein
MRAESFHVLVLICKEKPVVSNAYLAAPDVPERPKSFTR